MQGTTYDTGTKTIAAKFCGDIPKCLRRLQHIVLMSVYAKGSDDIGERSSFQQHSLFTCGLFHYAIRLHGVEAQDDFTNNELEEVVTVW